VIIHFLLAPAFCDLCVPCFCLQRVLKHWYLPRSQVKAKQQAFLEANPWSSNTDVIRPDESVQHLPLDIMLKMSSNACNPQW
jgi:hypothetical protein